MAKFSPLIPSAHLASLLQQVTVPDALRSASEEWAEHLNNYQSKVLKEQQNRGRFLSLLFERGLGFRPDGAVAADQPFTMREEQKTELDSDRPDASFGRFGGAAKESATYAVLELKDAGTDLDQKQGGAYGKTPVEQGFAYADKHTHAEFILVSDFRRIRLYAREARQLKAWEFDFRRLGHEDKEAALKELAFFLSPERLLPSHAGARPRLLDHIQAAPKDKERVTREFYLEFRALRDELRAHYEGILLKLGRADASQTALQAAQKAVNRALFAGFVQSRALLPDGLLQDLTTRISFMEDKPVFHNLRLLFRHMDKGKTLPFRGNHAELKIQKFNGGLFRLDGIVDGEDFPLTEKQAAKLIHLADRDFVTELPVSVLGHCFESSLGDLDVERKSEARHQDGIYYTPDWVTRAICRRVLGPLVERCRAEGNKAAALIADETERGLTALEKTWNAVADLRILDPACGSGAFLAMGLRVLRELLEPDYRRARALASSLPDVAEDIAHEELPGFSAPVETPRVRALARLEALPALDRCFYGVDLHDEAVMLAQLSLWLETAEKGRKLSDLSDRIKTANSLTADWNGLFPGTRFDAVIGNPPYVRMELFKDLKPHLKTRFPEVHEERADLYCYFFQLSFELLKEGGRYGVIVSNKWLKAKYGAPSRAYLKAQAQLEAILDFGELPVFEDAGVMPLIVTGEKRSGGTVLPLRFAQIPALPDTDHGLDDLETQHAHEVPASQLGPEAWLLVDAAQGLVFARRAAKGVTLREYLGDTPICWGIKTGLNDAFWINEGQRDTLVATNPEAKLLLKPLVIGDDVRRWAVQQDSSRYLIYTPKGRYSETEFLDRFPAVAKHLAPFRSYPGKKGKIVGLDHRATKQQWFELQQAQEAYHSFFEGQQILWPFFAMSPRFMFCRGIYPNNNCYSIPSKDQWLVAFLNSKLCWLQIIMIGASLGNAEDGGRMLLYENLMERIVIPQLDENSQSALTEFSTNLHELSIIQESSRRAFTSVLRTAPWRCATLGARLERFWELDADTLLAEALKRREKGQKKDPTMAQREELKRLWREASEPMRELAHTIANLEADLERAVEAAWGEP